MFITNGGLGGPKAIPAGVPFIVAGLTEDKPAVAARVASHGLGIDLQRASPAPEESPPPPIVLKDTGMHAIVHKLAQVYAAHEALKEIERLTLS